MVIFIIQATFFAILVTPLADVPDESGHFAYVIDASKGRPLPVHTNVTNGRGVIPDDLWFEWAEQGDPRVNYIVQHPPLYYWAAAIPYSVAKHFSNDRFIHAYAARSVSAISLGVIVIAVYLTLVAAGVSQGQALLMSSWLPLLPMMTHLSSGITNDVFLVMLCALSTLYLVKYLKEGHIRFAYYCAFWLACAGATKMTAWLLIAAYVGILVYELRGSLKSWLVHSTLIGLASTITALWWMRRNYYWFGNPFNTAGSPVGDIAVTNPISWVAFFQQKPFVEWFMQHTHGLFGFSGYCVSAKDIDTLATFCRGIEMTVVRAAPYWLMLTSMIVVILALWFKVVQSLIKHTQAAPGQASQPSSIQSSVSGFLAFNPKVSVTLWLFFTLFGLAFSYWFVINGFKHQPIWGHLALAPAALLFGVTFAAFPAIFISPNLDTRLIAYGSLAAILFVFTLYTKTHGVYETDGVLRGVQGRYLFPFYPLLLLAIGVATKNSRLWLWVSLVLTIALVWGHLYSYSHVLIPFFNWVKL